MKKAVCLLVLVLVTSGCSIKAPESAPNSTGVSFSMGEELRDLGGNTIDLNAETVKSFNINYSVGWSLDDTNYKKIFVGDTVGGYEVNTITSNYFIEYNKNGNQIICNINEYTIAGEKAVHGVFVKDKDGIGFYPYYNENRNNFLLLCRYNEDSYKMFKAASFLNVDESTTVHIQPIRIAIDDEMLVAKMPQKTEPEFFDATIKFSSITFTTFSQGEGAEVYGTRANGFVSDIDDIVIEGNI